MTYFVWFLILKITKSIMIFWYLDIMILKLQNAFFYHNSNIANKRKNYSPWLFGLFLNDNIMVDILWSELALIMSIDLDNLPSHLWIPSSSWFYLCPGLSAANFCSSSFRRCGPHSSVGSNWAPSRTKGHIADTRVLCVRAESELPNC